MALAMICRSLAADVPATGPAENSTASVNRLVDELSDVDPTVRRKAHLILINLSGDALDPVQAALKREDLGPEARRSLQTAVKRLKLRAAKLKIERDDHDWMHRTALAEYRRVGHKDARWDQLVRDGIDAYARIELSNRVQAEKDFQQAIDAGCDDPFVEYLEARCLSDSGGNRAVVAERLREAARGMVPSKYDTAWKVTVMLRCFQVWGETPEAPADELLKMAVENAHRPDVPVLSSQEPFTGLMEPLTRALGREEAFKKIMPFYEQAFPHSAMPQLFKGVFYTNFAWDARGGGYANTVTPEGWKLFGERLEEAAGALEKGWKLDSTNAAIATQMITVKMGQSDKAGIDEWFRHAIDADPDNAEAYHKMLYCLYPRWYGSHEEMIALGREAEKTENYFASIPFLLADAHMQVAAESGNPQAYFHSPEVWADISPIYESAMLVYPGKSLECYYVQWAMRCGQLEEARKLFSQIGDHPDPRVFPDQRVYDQLRDQAKAGDAAAAGNGAAEPPQ